MTFFLNRCSLHMFVFATLQAEDAFYYRFPRQYLGTIQYDRMPCKPYSLYGTVLDLENGCPEVPTDSPTVPFPTSAPVVALVARQPRLHKRVLPPRLQPYLNHPWTFLRWHPLSLGLLYHLQHKNPQQALSFQCELMLFQYSEMSPNET